MKYSRTALRELTRLYRAVLLAAIIGTVAIAGTAKAESVTLSDLTDSNGNHAIIWNETSGGGARFVNNTANTVSYVGVNNGGAAQGDIDVQIYSKDATSNVGTRLNVNPTGIYYTTGVTGKDATNTADQELVTVGTVATKATFDSTADYTDGTVGKAIKDLTTVAYSGTNYLDSVTTLTGADAALDTQIKANADAIATLNGDASTAGSVAKSIADALANSQNPYQTGTEVAATVKSDAEDADFTPASSSTVLANEKTIGDAINTLGGAVDTINTNVSTISTNVGAVSDFTSSETGNISNSAPGEGTNATTTSAAIANIDATIGQIHSLASTIDTTEGSGNLEQGSTVSGHLLALAGAIGDRSDYTGANYLTNNQDIADSLVTLDGALGDVEDIVDNHNTSLNAIAQLVDGGSVDATGTYTAGEALTAYDSATTLTGVVNKLETKKQDTLVVAADSGLKMETDGVTLSVLAGAGMEVTTAGVGIKAAGVGTDMLGAKVVTTEKIDDGAVTLIKLGTDVATTTAATGDTKLITSGGVYDIANVALAGTYIAAGTAVGSNLSLLDTAVKANADAIDTKAGLDDDNVFSGTNTFGSTTGSQVVIGNNGTITADGKTQLTQIGSSGEYALTVEQDGSTGHVTVNGGLEVSEDVAIDGTLDVGGNFMVDGTTGDTTVGGALDVTGAATFGDTLDVAGNTTVGGDLTVSGTTTLADTTVGGDFAVTGDTLLADTTVDGNLGVTGNASVDGDFLVSGDTLLQNTLEVTGATTLNSTLDVASDTTIGGTLDITGLTTFGTDGFNLGGNTADAIDTDGSAVAAGTTTTLATAATIKLGAGSADYTPTGSNITKTTLAGGLDDLDAAIGVRTYTNEYNITSDDDVATSLDDLDTIIGDIANVTNTNGNITGNDIAEKLDTIDTNMGDLATMDHAAFGGAPADITSGVNALATNFETATGGTFDTDGSWAATVAPAAANSYAYTESANIMDAINQVAGNVGTAAELTTAGTNGVAVANSVNANIDAVNTKLGDIDGIANANGNVGGADVAAKLDSVDAAIGDLAAAQASSQYIEPGQDIASSLSTLDGSLARVEHDLGRLENEVRGGFAAAAAMSALVPNARAAGDTQIAVGTGNYRDRVGFALGAFHYINDNILVNAGAAYGGSKSTTFRAGVTFGW